MNLRQAIKICRKVYEDKYKWNAYIPLYGWRRVAEARRVCKRHKWRYKQDKRMPHIPSERELDEQAEMFGMIFEQLACKLTGKPSTLFDMVEDDD